MGEDAEEKKKCADRENNKTFPQTHPHKVHAGLGTTNNVLVTTMCMLDATTIQQVLSESQRVYFAPLESYPVGVLRYGSNIFSSVTYLVNFFDIVLRGRFTIRAVELPSNERENLVVDINLRN